MANETLFTDILTRLRPGYEDGGLVQKDFIELYEKFPGGSDAEFSEFIEKEKGVKLKAKAVNERRRRANLLKKKKQDNFYKDQLLDLNDFQKIKLLLKLKNLELIQKEKLF